MHSIKKKSFLIVVISTLMSQSINLLALDRTVDVEDRSILLDSNYKGDLDNTSVLTKLSNKYQNLPYNKRNTVSSNSLEKSNLSTDANPTGGFKSNTNVEVINNPDTQIAYNATSDNSENKNSDPSLISSEAELDSESSTSNNSPEQQVNNVINQIKSLEPTNRYKSKQPLATENNTLITESTSFEIVDDETSTARDDSNIEVILSELQSMPLGERLKRIENIVELHKKQNLEHKIKTLQEEVQSLRGVLESMQHSIDKSLAQQRLLFDDLDRRLSQLGSGEQKSQFSPANYGFSSSKQEQQDLYTQAYQSIKQRDYDKAIELFNIYLKKYSKGVFCANSNYWLGEIYMIKSDYSKALEYFDIVLKDYSDNSKAADALYKKGIINIYLQDFANAKKILLEVKRQYKNTTVARLADQKLQSIENMNNES